MEAVNSVLSQEDTGFELIVVDDGSTDGTGEALAQFIPPLRYHQQTNQGVSAARNQGVQLSRAPLIAFLDSDDLWLPRKLRMQKAYMTANPGIMICQTEEIWQRHGRRLNPKPRHRKPSGDIFQRSLDLCLISPSAVMMRRELFEQVGYFDEALPVAEDYDLWLRVTVDHSVPLLPEPLVVKRGGHPGQLSATAAMDCYRVRALQKLLMSGRLSERQYGWTLEVLRQKCQIYAQGCLKRGRAQEAATYLTLPDRYDEKAGPGSPGVRSRTR